MKGTYIILLKLKKDKTIQIGRIGNMVFKKGYYVYVGSALNGLEQRINRHLRKHKKIRWHIDYLLQYGIIIDIFYKENNKKEECSLAKKFERILFSISNFGCSDCKCNTHLFYGALTDILNIINKVGMKQYLLNAKI